MTTANAEPTPETPAAATPTTPTDAQPPATDAAAAAADTPPAAEESASLTSDDEPPGSISPAITDPEVTERLFGGNRLHGEVSNALRHRIAAECSNAACRPTWDTVAAGLLLAAPGPVGAAILAAILLVRFNVLADVSTVEDKPGQLQLAMRANEQTAKDAEAFVNALGIFDSVTVLRV